MEDPSGPTWLGVALGWSLMALLVGGLVYVVRLTHKRGASLPPPGYWAEQLEIERESLKARKETNRLLAELAAKLEK